MGCDRIRRLEALRAHLDEALPRDLEDPSFAVDALVALPGGNSRATYRATGTNGRELVVQMSRVGPVAASERDAIDAARRAGVAAPRVAAGGPASAVGAEILVTEALPGEASPRRIAADAGLDRARRSLPVALGGAAGRLHRVSADADGTEPLARLRARAAATGAHRPALALGLRTLDRVAVPRRPTCLVHGDLRLGNVLVDATGLVAVLDWEVAHPGQPGEDLGWLLNPVWRLGGDGPLDQPEQVDALLNAYSAAAGWRPEARELAWWQLFGASLWVVACLELVQRSRAAAAPDAEQLAAGLQTPAAELVVLDLVEAVHHG